MNTPRPATEPLSWKQSLFWLVLAALCFNLAYFIAAKTSGTVPQKLSGGVSRFPPAAGLLLFGYALGLVKLTNQTSVRRAFYFGLATGYLSYAPQLLFMWNIFGPAAPVLWLVLAFWIGLFTAIICGATRPWGRNTALWLIPVVWTGVEYFRSELYYLKFSWLNFGYALPLIGDGNFFIKFGMYSLGFLVLAGVILLTRWRWFKRGHLIGAIIVLGGLCGMAFSSAVVSAFRFERPNPPLAVAGIQLEFPNENIVSRALDKAFRKYPESKIFVLSEYTLDGPVPDTLKNWCRTHGRFLVVGGKEHLPNDNYYNTAYVVGTNGEIIFQQVKSVPIQFFKDGLPAPKQGIWNSPWGKIGICICYDLSYTRVTDELIRQGAQLLIVPTMDVAEWGLYQHELHARVAPVRAAEYGVPIFRLASSGISQAVNGRGGVVAQTTFPGNGDILSAKLQLPSRGSLPADRWLAPVCVAATGLITVALLWLAWREKRRQIEKENTPV